MGTARRFLAWYWQPRPLRVILATAVTWTAAVVLAYFLARPLFWACVGLAFTDAVIMAFRPVPGPLAERGIDPAIIGGMDDIELADLRRAMERDKAACAGAIPGYFDATITAIDIVLAARQEARDGHC